MCAGVPGLALPAEGSTCAHPLVGQLAGGGGNLGTQSTRAELGTGHALSL